MARLSAKEAGPALAAGDEHVDLGDLNQDVRRMQATTNIKMSQVLRRSAVADKTWSKICAQLGTVDGARATIQFRDE
jgi:hypothetical protein